jgi:hypothetical protein
MEKTSDEESKSKDVLDNKLKIDQNLLDIREEIDKLTGQH